MRNKGRVFASAMVVLLAAMPCIAGAQKPVPPPPKPADTGPSLAATMQFIQEKMNGQGQVGYVWTRSDLNAITYRTYYTISNVSADIGSCTLQTTETTVVSIEVATGNTYNEGGQPVTGDDLKRRSIDVSTTSFKDVESITVVSMQDKDNLMFAQQAHPEITATVTPPAFYLVLTSSTPKFSFHTTFVKGNASPQISDTKGSLNTFRFRDEEMANRVAKAMLHAVELCGGGSKDPF